MGSLLGMITSQYVHTFDLNFAVLSERQGQKLIHSECNENLKESNLEDDKSMLKNCRWNEVEEMSSITECAVTQLTAQLF